MTPSFYDLMMMAVMVMGLFVLIAALLRLERIHETLKQIDVDTHVISRAIAELAQRAGDAK